MCWNPLQGQVYLGFEVEQGSFHLAEILSLGILELTTIHLCKAFPSSSWCHLTGDHLGDQDQGIQESKPAIPGQIISVESFL